MTDRSSTGAGSSGKAPNENAGTTAPTSATPSAAPQQTAESNASAVPPIRPSPLRQPATIDLKANPETSATKPTADASNKLSDKATAGAAQSPSGSKQAGSTSAPGRPATDGAAPLAAAGSSGAGAGAADQGGAKGAGKAPPTGAAQAPKSGLGFGGGLLAAVIGAGAGVAGAWIVSVISPTGIATIQQDGALEQKFSALEQQLAAQVNALAPKSEMTALSARVTEVDGRLAALANEAKALAQQIATAQPAPAATSSGAKPDNAEARMQHQAQDGALAARLTAMAEQLTSLQQATREASAQANEARSEVGALAGAVRSIDMSRADAAASAAAEAGRRVATIDARVGELGRNLAARSKDPRIAAIARALAASEVLQAIQEGRPFASDIAALAAAGGDPAAMARLQAGAAGLATVAALRQDFAPLADRLSALQHQNEGMLDRLKASASRLVRIRPVDQDGQPVAAEEGTLERLTDALQRGDLDMAARAWASLPEALRRESSAFGAALQARVSAEQAARAALNDALAAIASQGAAATDGAVQTQGGRP